MPRFSVITVCRNMAGTLPRTAESLWNQSFGDWEWIVVDGASSDGTAEWLREKSATVPLKFVSEPDSGIYDAMNKGIRMAAGEYLHFLNADDFYHDTGVLDDVANFLSRDPACDFLYGSVKVTDHRGTSWDLHPPPPEEALAFMIGSCLPQPGSFFRRTLFLESMGFFSTAFKTASDYQWMLRALSDDRVTVGRIERLIVNFAATGASSHLEQSFPEVWAVLNAETRFWDKLGVWNGIRAYQHHVMKLALELEKVRDEAWKRGEQTVRLKNKLEQNRSLIEKLKGKLQAKGAAKTGWLDWWRKRLRW